MKRYLFSEILAACGGQYFGDPALLNQPAADIVIDSKLAQPGSLFVAIIGERHDAHAFIPDARHNGASLVVSNRKLEREPYILVPDTLRALHDIARRYRAMFSIPVIGLTGSAGKTSTKDMVAAALGERYHVMKTHGNLNNETGAALTILSLSERHEAAVVELGTNHFGEIDRIASFVQPDICLFTNIGLAHVENFGSREGVFQGKAEMLRHMRPGGSIIANGDDEYLRDIPGALLYGVGANCAVRCEQVEDLILDGMMFTAVFNGRRCRMRVPALGLHSVYNALAAVSAGLLLGMTLEEIASGIASYKPMPGRMNIHKLPRCTVIDDTYNSNPTSAKASLDVLAKCSGRRVAILGDMLELGQESSRFHEETGRYAASLGIEVILCVGPESERMFFGTLTSSGGESCFFPTQDKLIASLPEYLQEGDTILVKASRGMKLEQVVRYLFETT
jgi:UDP-N-acetylmuramoyl-tripeptide--D-alanyl-D-alanine ligase